MDITDTLVLKRNPDVIERIGEEVLLFDATNGKLFELNETGKAIWMLLDGSNTIKTIKKRIEDEFEGGQENNNDLSKFINKLLELNLIEKLK